MNGEWRRHDNNWYRRELKQFGGTIHGLRVRVTEKCPGIWCIEVESPWYTGVRNDVRCTESEALETASRCARAVSIGFECAVAGGKSSYQPDLTPEQEAAYWQKKRGK